jgi:hypothetical protein
VRRAASANLGVLESVLCSQQTNAKLQVNLGSVTGGISGGLADIVDPVLLALSESRQRALMVSYWSKFLLPRYQDEESMCRRQFPCGREFSPPGELCEKCCPMSSAKMASLETVCRDKWAL